MSIKPERSEQHKRNIAIAVALDALGTDTGTSPGLSPIQCKVLRVLLKGEPITDYQWKTWQEQHPNFYTVVLPTLLVRGLIKETVEHEPALDPRWLTQPRKLAPINHRDVAITEAGLLTLLRFERTKLEAHKRAQPWRYP